MEKKANVSNSFKAKKSKGYDQKKTQKFEQKNFKSNFNNTKSIYVRPR